MPLKMKIRPSAMKASALCGASAATNCGRKARKNSATLGLSTLVSAPCQNTFDSEPASVAAAARSAACARARQQHPDADQAEIGRASPLHQREGGRRCGQQRRKADRAGKHVDETAGADAERRGRAAAPADLHAAADDIGGVRARRDVEQQAGDDEEPEIVNAEHRCRSHVGQPPRWNYRSISEHVNLSCLACVHGYCVRTPLPPDTAWFAQVLVRIANRPPPPAGRFSREGPMERRLAAIVCADIAGYSRMMGTDEAGTHASFKAHRSAIYPIILNHGGRLVKNTGDGFLLEFPSIVGAIEAAIAMQTVMAERNHHLPADRVMQFRMGIHMGDVIADEDEVFGDDVNIAVRLETVAAPGGIAVSDKAYTEAGKHLSVTLADAGPASLQEHRGTHPGLDLGAGRTVGKRPRFRQRRRSKTCRASTEPRSSACCPSTISAAAPTNIFPTD